MTLQQLLPHICQALLSPLHPLDPPSLHSELCSQLSILSGLPCSAYLKLSLRPLSCFIFSIGKMHRHSNLLFMVPPTRSASKEQRLCLTHWCEQGLEQGLVGSCTVIWASASLFMPCGGSSCLFHLWCAVCLPPFPWAPLSFRSLKSDSNHCVAVWGLLKLHLPTGTTLGTDQLRWVKRN